MKSMFSILFFAALAMPAHAHWGHVGELAGHGHVIAVGALIGAAALAAALLRPQPDEDRDEDAESETETEEAPV